jgi:GAF domain-containing protein
MDTASATAIVPELPRFSAQTEWARRRLAPLMRLWRAAIKQTLSQVPRPFDNPHAHAPGPNSARVLIFGAGLSVGWGVSTHDLALPGFLARSLAPLTGRGIDIDLVAHPDIHSGEALRRLNALRLWRYDAIVVVLGVNESLYLASSTAWGKDLATLLARLQETVGVPVVLTGIQRIRSIPVYDSVLGSIADIHAATLNRVSARVCAEAPQASYVPLPDFALPESGRHRTPSTFAESARIIAAALAPVLAVPRHGADEPYRAAMQDDDAAEAIRQAAVDALDLSNPELCRTIDQLLDRTRLAFNTATAAFSVLDKDMQLRRTSGADSIPQLPRAGSFCDTTIGCWGGMAVPDALLDERFRDHHLVTGEPHVRFYAGFPVESRSGERIGTLCVYDSEPRHPDEIDLAGLRDFALKLQHELQLSA